MKRLLVLGGGFAGGAVAAAGLARGWEVAVSTRSPGPRVNLPDGVERLSGDDASEDVRKWSQGRDLIVDAAAPYALSLHQAGATRQTRINAASARMKTVLAAAADASAALIHIGSFVTMAPPSTTQGRMVHASHPYFAIKKVMADLCLSAAQSGQPVGVALPTALFGPGDLRGDDLSFVGGILAQKLAAAPPNDVNVVDVRDMAEAVLRMAEMGWFGASVALSGHNTTVADLGALIADLGGVSAPSRVPGIAQALPFSAAALYAVEAAAAPLGLATPPALPTLLTLAGGCQPTSPAQQALGVTPRPLAETIADEIAWRRRPT